MPTTVKYRESVKGTSRGIKGYSTGLTLPLRSLSDHHSQTKPLAIVLLVPCSQTEVADVSQRPQVEEHLTNCLAQVSHFQCSQALYRQSTYDKDH